MSLWTDPEYSEALEMKYSRHKDGRVMTEDRCTGSVEDDR